MINKIYSFDFDDTLVHTPEQEEGKKLWKLTTGLDWPYVGWWSKPESLNQEIFDSITILNPWVYNKYLEAIADNNSLVIMATGRIKALEKEVNIILNKFNLEFDQKFFNWGGDTFTNKCKVFERIMEQNKAKELIMYDDRQEHLFKFREWANKQPFEVEIIDVKNKRNI
jgi:hypothetical protein